jgi:tetratricopeptide (TPR) repeat protein
VFTSGIFSHGGISFTISNNILDYYGQRFDRDDIKALTRYNFLRTTINLLMGNWKEQCYDESFVNRGLLAGEMFNLVTYIAFHAQIYIERGDRKSEKLIDKLSEASELYENDYGRLVCFSHGALNFLKIRALKKALSASDAGIGFVLKDLGNRPGLLMVYSLKIRTQILLGDVNGAEETLRIASELISKDTFVPYFQSFYLTSQLMFNLYNLEEAINRKDQGKNALWSKRVLKSGKQAVRVSKWAVFECTETFRMMGVYYWLMGKQKKAIKWWRRSIRKGEKLGARLELSRTYLEVARRLLESKEKNNTLDGISAEGYLKMARKLFKEMDLKWDLKVLEKVPIERGK